MKAEKEKKEDSAEYSTEYSAGEGAEHDMEKGTGYSAEHIENMLEEIIGEVYPKDNEEDSDGAGDSAEENNSADKYDADGRNGFIEEDDSAGEDGFIEEDDYAEEDDFIEENDSAGGNDSVGENDSVRENDFAWGNDSAGENDFDDGDDFIEWDDFVGGDDPAVADDSAEKDHITEENDIVEENNDVEIDDFTREGVYEEDNYNEREEDDIWYDDYDEREGDDAWNDDYDERDEDDAFYDDYDENEEDAGRRPKKKKRRRRRVALWKKLLLTLEFLILAAIILAAVYLAQSGFFEESDVKFGELAVDEIYYVAGQGETATFTIQAADSEMEMQLCDADETAVGILTDDGQNGDETAGDGIYTCVLPIEDTDEGARTYHVKEAKTTSNEVTIYIFQTMDAEALESACSVCDEVWGALQEIESKYIGTSGYVTVDDFPDIFAEVETYLETLAEDGTVIRYVVEDESAYIKFASGLSLCYEPILEDTFSGENDVQLTVTYIQQDDGSYAADCKETMDSSMAQIENLEQGETYEGNEVTLSLVKSLSADQVIVWYGHGTWSAVTGSGLVLDATVDKADQADLFRDYLTTAYLEDGEQHLVVTAAYVAEYCGDLSDDLIFLSACDGGKDSRLADAFLACGATAVLGFSDSVLCEYASGIIDGVLEYMLRAWPESEWFYTLEQALERAESELGENDAVWLGGYADLTDELADVAACGAEPVLLTREALDADDTDGGIRLSTEKGALTGTTYFYAESPEPAAGVTVTIRQEGDLYMELITDENGEYAVSALPVGTYDITFSLEGYGDYYLEQVVVARDETTGADGYFFANDSITGTVVDALTGKPLAEVEVELLIGDGETIYKQTVQTDENGSYAFDLTEDSKSAALSELVKYFEGTDYSDLLEGSTVMTEKQLSPEGLYGYTMGISGSGVILFEKDGYVDVAVEITVTGFDSPDMGATELTPEVEIGGYVYDANGNVLGGVTITAVVTDDGSSDEQDDQDDGSSDGQDSQDDGSSDEQDNQDDGSSDGQDNQDEGSEGGGSDSDNGEDGSADDTEGTGNSDGTEETGGSEGTGGTEEAGDSAGTVAAGNSGVVNAVINFGGTDMTVSSTTSSTAATGDTIETETDVNGYYTLGFEIGSKITISVTYSLSGYDTKTVEYEIDSSMVVDGKVQLSGVSLTRSKQVVAGTSYASGVVSFESGDPWTSISDAMNPADALGEPDYSDNKNAVTLGAGGVLVLEFDVDFCNGDGIDIYIYEVGDDVETTLVEVSRDGESWVNVGSVDGSTSGIDLEGLVSARSTFRYIRLTDLGSHTSGFWPGADIDAVAVMYHLQ